MNKEIVKEFIELKIKEKAIGARIDELKPLILSEMIAADVDKVPTTLGNINIKGRKVWKYSDAVKALDDKLKEQKKTEEADGTATFENFATIEFRETKTEIKS